METILLQPGDPEGILGANKTNGEAAVSMLSDNSKQMLGITPNLCLELVSFNYSIRQQLTPDATDGGWHADQPIISELTCVKCGDLSSTKLYEYCLRGKTLGSGKERPSYLYVIHHSEDKLIGMMKYELRDAIVSNLMIQSSSEGLALEQLSINFTEYIWIWFNFDANGNPMGQTRAGWSLTQKRPISSFTV